MPTSARQDTIRRSAGIVVAALLLVTAVVFVVRSPESALSQQPPDTTSPTGSGATSTGATTGSTTSSAPSGSAPGGSGSTGSAPSASGSSTATSTSAPPTSTGSGGSLAVGPGRTAAGVQMVGQPRSDGSWDVIEYVRPTSATATLRLSLPQVSRVPAFTGQKEQVSEFQATAADQLAVISGQPGANWQVQATTPTTQFVLRYVLAGATVRSVPSKAGRALTVLGPVADPGTTTTPVEIVAAGSTVRGLQCPLLSGDAQLCQAGTAPNLRTGTFLPRSTALALVQFDLPAPS